MIQKNAARLEHAIGSGEIIPEPFASNVLSHPNAYDCVIKFRALSGDVAIIAQLNFHLGIQSRVGDARLRPFRLRFAERDSLGAHPEMFGRVNDEPAPATADVEQTLAGPEPQFAADVIEFLF